MDVTVIDVIKQMTYVIPTIIAATCTLTAAIHGIFKIEKAWVNHLISWLLAVGVAEAFVGFNGLTFGLGGWDYAVGALCGLITGAAANGVYDWEKIKAFFDMITNLFSGNKQVECDPDGVNKAVVEETPVEVVKEVVEKPVVTTPKKRARKSTSVEA